MLHSVVREIVYPKRLEVICGEVVENLKELHKNYNQVNADAFTKSGDLMLVLKFLTSLALLLNGPQSPLKNFEVHVSQ
ncbi:hypothetical protein PR048_012821, partial [Dryococelus australis]